MSHHDALATLLDQYIDNAVNAAVTPLRVELDREKGAHDTTRAELVAALARIAELETPAPEPEPTFLVGAAYGGNTDPAPVEARAGAKYGIRRTYWDYSKLNAAVNTAAADIAAGRVPYISFKVGTSWTQAANGAVDETTRVLADRLGALGGRVMVSIHHEPEGDEPDISRWVAMQRRLGPLFADHDNIAFGTCLTGYHQREDSPATYSLETLWPGNDAGVSFIGLDAYQLYGSQAGKVTAWTDLPKHLEWYGRWAASKGIDWGLAETGISDDAFTSRFADRAATWIPDTIAAMKDSGGSFFCYFDSSLNSTTTWAITPGTEKDTQFLAALREHARP